MIRRPPRSTLSSSSAASDVYKRQEHIRSDNIKFELQPSRLRISTNCGTTILDRELGFEADPAVPPDAVWAENSPFFAAQIVKKNSGQCVRQVFEGDTVWLRCLDEQAHTVKEEEDEVEVEVQIPPGSQASHVSNVVTSHGLISFQVQGWGRWSRQVQEHTYGNGGERDRFLDWSGATWHLVNDHDTCAIVFVLPKFNRSAGNDKSKQSHGARPLFIQDDDPFKLLGMVEARMWASVQDHFKKRDQLSQDANEHIKDFDKAKLLPGLYALQGADTHQALEPGDFNGSDRQLEIWQQVPSKPLSEWRQEARSQWNLEWTQSCGVSKPAPARPIKKTEKKESPKAQEQPELTRLQQRILDKQRLERDTQHPKLLYKTPVQPATCCSVSLQRYSWENCGNCIKISVPAEQVQHAQEAQAVLEAEFDGFLLTVKDGTTHFLFKVENLKHEIEPDRCTVRWRASSSRAIIKLVKSDPGQEWSHLSRGSA
eukprot:TRINITY_DN7076_c0_g1_i2.p1 TRINITY_DN7076_c0_g1~~TRINITY_DN7076_c0_g1_i2.p1  ORF type:complete len:484 (+),score=121.27 TRINITY_DN7076_c0_g1_i2:110-1561(+)